MPPTTASPEPPRRLSRRDRLLVALGLAAWIALLAGGAWFVHRLHAMRERCRDTMNSPTAAHASNAATPGTGLRTLTLPQMCK